MPIEINESECKAHYLPEDKVRLAAELFHVVEHAISQLEFTEAEDAFRQARASGLEQPWLAPTAMLYCMYNDQPNAAIQAAHDAEIIVACWMPALQARFRKMQRALLDDVAINQPQVKKRHERSAVFLCDEQQWKERREREPDVDNNRAHPFDRMRGLLEFKPLACRATRVLDGLGELARQQPNFSTVVDIVRAHLHANGLMAAPIKLPPLLLYGPPGTGKTRFAKRLASLMKVPTREISLAGMSDALKLSGLGQHWSTRGPGAIAQFLASCPVGNPVLIFDEIDKTGTSERGNPLDRLLYLLEEETASTFEDEYVEIPIDASYVSVIATANEISHLPAPLLSRFICLDVSVLDIHGRRVMVEAVYAELREKEAFGSFFGASLANEVVALAASQQISGRDLKRMLRMAMQRACLAVPQGEKPLSPLILELAHFQDQRWQNSRRMGFTG